MEKTLDKKFDLRFEATDQILGTGDCFDIVLGDIDADGDIDVITTGGISDPCRIWQNDGKGVFSDVQCIQGALSHGVALSDLDNDGDLDLFLVFNNSDKKSRIISSGREVYSDEGSKSGSSGGTTTSIQIPTI